MEVRPAAPEDLDAICRIVDAAYSPYIARIGKKPGPMNEDYAALLAAGHVWVAGTPAAGLLVLLEQPDHMLLDNIAVDPARHGQGIGRALMRFAEAEAARRGHAELRLYTHETMTENIDLYARAGWSVTGRGVQDGFSRVFFRKGLG